MDFFGGKISRSIQAHQIPIIHKTEKIKVFATLQGSEQLVEFVIIGSVERFTQPAVPGNVGDIIKGFQVVAVKAFFQAPLKLQQGRVLEKHQGKAAHKAIVQGVIQRTLSRVFDLLQAH